MLITDKVPPSRPDIEKTILGTLISHPAGIDEIKDVIDSSAFYVTKHAEIYNTMLKMREAGIEIDIVTLPEYIHRSGFRIEYDIELYLAELCDSMGSIRTLPEYVKIVNEKSILRKIISNYSEVAQQVYSENPVIDDILARMECSTVEVANSCDNAKINRKKSGRIVRAAELKERFLEYRKQGLKGLGIAGVSLDQVWPNTSMHIKFAKRMLNIWTGIPGHGKSEMLDATMVNLSQLHGFKWGVFSPENFPYELHIQKYVEKLLNKNLFNSSEAEIEPALNFIDEHIFWLEPDEENIKIDNLLSMNLEAKKKFGISGIVWDPWNEIEMDPKLHEKETDYIGRMLGKIRRHARRHDYMMNIIAHPTKVQKDLKTKKYIVPTLYDINGCYDSETEVLTFNGWKKHCDVDLSTEVACFDLETEAIRYEKPSKIWVKDYEGEMYHFTSPSYDVLVTPNHRMVVKPAWENYHKAKNTGLGRPFKYNRGGWNFKNAEELKGNLVMPWASEFEDYQSVETICGYNANLILKIIGWWISEGCYNKTSKGITFCQSVGKLSKKMSDTLKELKISFSESFQKPGTNGSKNIWVAYIGYRKNKELCEWMVKNCGIGAKNKKLPEITWFLSKKQKEILLKSLIEGDGSVSYKDTYTYSTTSKKLSDDVQRLSIECGRMSIINTYKSKKIGHADKIDIKIGCKSRKTICLRSDRNLNIEKYSGKVYCLTVPTGAYLTRRNFKPSICGNSANWYNKADNGFCTYRHFAPGGVQPVPNIDFHIQKVKFKIHGKVGVVQFNYDRESGRLNEHDTYQEEMF